MAKKMPWEYDPFPPFRIFGNLYFVGTKPYSTHLIDTGEGLILIDPGTLEGLHLVVDKIWRLGFRPEDVKIILISHAHYDHSDAARALKEMTGAEICLGRRDLRLVTGEIFHYPLIPFKPDRLLEDGDIVSLGNTAVKCLATPGHTEGCFSFFFPVTDGKKTVRAGMFGGAGMNSMEKAFLEENGLSLGVRDEFLQSLEKARKEKVDLFVGNHASQNDTPAKYARLLQGETDAFLDPDEWEKRLDSWKEKLLTMLRKEGTL